jgi:hypothetical protein
MALISTTLETVLKIIFNTMNNMSSGGNAYCAEKTALAIKDYILTGQVSTTDTGVAPAGYYKGAGTGIMTINTDTLKSDLQTTFEAACNNDDLAARMAADIDNACKADNTVLTTSIGTVTTPSGATSPFSGPAQGKFTGLKSTIESKLKTCFSTMNGMSSGGNDYYAVQFASAIDAYLKAGAISVTLKVPPFASGTGNGKIA